MPGLWVQDAACQSGVAPILDRTREHLGTSDSGIARTRRTLLEAVRRLRDDDIRPASADQPQSFMRRAISITVPAGANWQEAGEQPMQARLGAGFGYEP